nr:MAG TPA: hypothetical protein [Caudoviricetes sp.]
MFPRQVTGPVEDSVRGLGASNLYSLGEGQRAGPTVHKKTESNRVLT